MVVCTVKRPSLYAWPLSAKVDQAETEPVTLEDIAHEASLTFCLSSGDQA